MKAYIALRGVGQMKCKAGANTGCMIAPVSVLYGGL